MFSPKMIGLLLASMAVVQLTGCGIQSIPQSENEVDATSAEVTNQYKRRADLIPNLVNTVKGYAAHEKETLEGVTEARAKAKLRSEQIAYLKEQLQQQRDDDDHLSSFPAIEWDSDTEKWVMQADASDEDIEATIGAMDEGFPNRNVNGLFSSMCEEVEIDDSD